MLWLINISGNFYFPFVSTSLTYLTYPKTKEKQTLPEIKKINYMREDHPVIYATFAVAKRKPEKNSGLYGIQTYTPYTTYTP